MVWNGFGPGEYRPTIPVPPLSKQYVQPVTYGETELAHYKPDKLPSYHSTELDKMPEDHFADLERKVAAERSRRELPHKQALFDGLSNFLKGAAHAMACRAALRYAAGHNPFGKNPASGEMWNGNDFAAMHECSAFETMPKNPDPKRDPKYAGFRLYSNPITWRAQADRDFFLKKTWNYASAYLH